MRLPKQLTIITLLLILFSGVAFAEGGHSDEKEFNMTEMIGHHVLDAHEWELFKIGDSHYSIYLPVILWTDEGLDVFSSSNFYHSPDHTYKNYELHHEHIVYTDKSGAPLDFSITKNVVSMFLAALLLLLIFTQIGSAYKKRAGKAPKGIQSLFEPVIETLINDMIRENLGEKKYQRYVPFILTLFFFILFNNLLGLIPTGANTSGNIAFTLTLAFFTLLVVAFSANGHYWRHMFAMPGVPWWVLPILTPIEIMGFFIRPAVLMIRLFANITGGHTIILSLMGLIFIFKSFFVGIPAVLFAVVMMFLELFVAFLQAYIFALLSTLYIGQAIDDGHH
ncbi:MAG: F0F1 ATP synthase subunit A [Bacteroidota bacterium]